MKIRTNLENVYLNEARLTEARTWSDVDDLMEELHELTTDEYGDYTYSRFESVKSYGVFLKLMKAWDKHVIAAEILAEMMDKTYGEIIEEDGDWYIKEDREELLRKEAAKEIDEIAREALDIGMKANRTYNKKDLDEYIDKHYKPEEDEDEYI